ncbi:MAG: 16S rRNA (adenine(1518)-N(6)/adenine(1519)-N(6))-dimethyltransferase RsmA [Actinobacteria bacterium]|nr:16S rRNA (adenine(1518)-N(6)/adenine(1519)-N(6))-dimethyltransferase RsmA [Actinomycetota bacterium]NDE12185.1 16S rRNA (adenine(1518)-N(6)/adenine(1519)-N(6))-dimethyltransferase RsmA [Actinomycetota bacterium]
MTITMLGASEIRKLAEDLQLRPSKSLGQNFVIDANTCLKIVRLAEIEAQDRVVEIGPGIGSLTLAILRQTKNVTAIELDERLAARLQETLISHGSGNIEIINEDALRVARLESKPNKLVANLPYNVSVPVLLTFLERFASIRSGVVMVQYEVAERLAATPGSKSYGVPSAKAAWWCDVQLRDSVSRSVFWPVPNVDSALLTFKHHDGTESPYGDEALRIATFAIIDNAFGKRRKMLRSALAGLMGSSATSEALLVAAGIDPTSRGESLDITQFARIAKAWLASK